MSDERSPVIGYGRLVGVSVSDGVRPSGARVEADR
ncbi:hypothetical protein GA0070614_5430 [Micromonospora coxensis]|uniref:Uncharacterized protein n=1 Tax=Micromonospora coxensis TaxID=356852 RepID=A0A1C5JUU5_9ACTN|nr:hypothetical protein GA0070614_5430 [Micromonospora coxensis]